MACDPNVFAQVPIFSLLAKSQMSQNRQDAKDRLRGELDYRVNLKAEMEISQLLERLDRVEGQLDAVVERGSAAGGSPA